MSGKRVAHRDVHDNFERKNMNVKHQVGDLKDKKSVEGKLKQKEGRKWASVIAKIFLEDGTL